MEITNDRRQWKNKREEVKRVVVATPHSDDDER
jgi:hypothetical protein